MISLITSNRWISDMGTRWPKEPRRDSARMARLCPSGTHFARSGTLHGRAETRLLTHFCGVGIGLSTDLLHLRLMCIPMENFFAAVQRAMLLLQDCHPQHR